MTRPPDGCVRLLTRDQPLHFIRPFAAKPKRYEAKHAEGTINQPPPEWNSAQPTKHKRVGNHQHARNQSEVEQPAVADGIAQRADESNCDDEMSKRQPVRAV